MSDSDDTQGKSQPRTKMLKTGIIASIILLADILLIWYNDFLGFIISIFLFWIVIPCLIVFLIAFIKSFNWKTEWHKVMFGCGVCVVLVFTAYLLFRAPKQNCGPEIMAEYYEEHKTEMMELCEYMQSVLADSTAVKLEFEGSRLVLFHVAAADAHYYSNFWGDDARSKRDSLMSVVGLTEEEYDGIRSRLKAMGCIGIEASRNYPESTSIWFRRVGAGMYSYILHPQPFTDDEKEKILENYTICPYNDHVLFEYGGAAWGSDNFPQKDKYLKKHKPW